MSSFNVTPDKPTPDSGFTPVEGETEMTLVSPSVDVITRLTPDQIDTLTRADRPMISVPTTSLAVDTPNLPVPREERDVQGRVTTNEKDAIKALKRNEWWALSFVGVLQVILDEVAQLDSKNRVLEARSELESRNRLVALAETTAELTKALYEDQAMEKMIEAVTSFASAATSSVQLGFMASSTRKSVREVEDKIKEQEKVVVDKKREAGWIGADGKEDLEKAKLEPPPALAEATKRLEELKAKKQDDIRNLDYNRNQMLTVQHEIVKSIVQGTGQTIQALVKYHEAELEYLKQINDGNLPALNKYNDTAAKGRDEAKANFDRVMDFLNKIVDSDFKAHSLGHAA